MFCRPQASLTYSGSAGMPRLELPVVGMQQVIYARIRPEIGFTARRRSLVGLCKDALRIGRIGPSSVKGLPDNKLAERD